MKDKGLKDKFVGEAKDKAGKVAGDKKMEAEGKAQKAAGKAKEVAADAKDKAEDLTDEAKKKFKK